MLKTGDIHWLAGLLEGEGHFGFYGSKRGDRTVGGSARILLGMSDRDVMERARDLMGFRPLLFRRKPSPLSTRPCWQFSLCGRRAAGWMMLLYPLMGERRREQIRESLVLWRAQRACARPTNLCGHPERPHSGRRMCKSCYCMWKQDRLRRELHPGLPHQ
jgi:hypothetical protein